MHSGKADIIFLNGTSSAGKSSIAKALQSRLDRPCIHWCIDDYLKLYPQDLWDGNTVSAQDWEQIIRGFHAAGAAMARENNLVIFDDVLEAEPPWIAHLLALFEGLTVYFVGVHCPLDVLERREQQRSDRKPGMARIQFEQVHAKAIYDIEVDTSTLTSDECAERILKYMASFPQPDAVKRLQKMK